MTKPSLIPIFPLALLPLPGELVPLHIFEPRYQQLLQDTEAKDIAFGIYLNHECNHKKLGSLMKLESVIKRYPEGESDIIVRCIDLFSMESFYEVHKDRLYPCGEVTTLQTDTHLMPGVELYELFIDFQQKRNINRHSTPFTLYQLAGELNLDLPERYRLMTLLAEKREAFLLRRLRFQLHIMLQEEKSKHVFHLN